jgi:hypothetical protein
MNLYKTYAYKPTVSNTGERWIAGIANRLPGGYTTTQFPHSPVYFPGKLFFMP